MRKIWQTALLKPQSGCSGVPTEKNQLSATHITTVVVAIVNINVIFNIVAVFIIADVIA